MPTVTKAPESGIQPSDERLVTETHNLVAATLAGAAASLLVAIAAVATECVNGFDTMRLYLSSIC